MFGLADRWRVRESSGGMIVMTCGLLWKPICGTNSFSTTPLQLFARCFRWRVESHLQPDMHVHAPQAQTVQVDSMHLTPRHSCCKLSADLLLLFGEMIGACMNAALAA